MSPRQRRTAGPFTSLANPFTSTSVISHHADTLSAQAGFGRKPSRWRGVPVLVCLSLLALAGAPAASRAAAGPQAPGVVAWGENEVGQLGDGSVDESDVPVSVPGLSEATSLAAGRRFTLALLSDGTVMSWGENVWGQLGDGTDTGPQTCHANFAEASHFEVPCSTTPVHVAGLSDVIAIATGAQHGLALLSNGTVMAWGCNQDGQLGDGTQTNSDVPVAVHGLSEVVAIAADQDSSLAVLRNGTVMSWGYDGWGALGQGGGASQDLPAPVSGLSNAKVIAGYLNSNLALLSDGTVMSWGENFFGELGDGTRTDSSVPVAVNGLNGVRAIARGEASLALLDGGTVMAWGSNISGELGIGTLTGPTECVAYGFCALTPVEVSELTGVRAIAAGNQHNLALLSDGEVMAWGENWDGQLGTGTRASTDTPVAVPWLRDATEIAAGDDRSFAYGVLAEPLPAVSGLNPSSGSVTGGKTVTITGKNLAGATAVRFGSVEARSFNVESEEAITAVSPPGTGTVDVTVTTPGGTSATEATDRFTYEPVVITKPIDDWLLSGSLAPSRLEGAIKLPQDSTFNGSATINPATLAGSLTGRLDVPPFAARLTAFGVAFTLKVALSQVGPLNGAIERAGPVAGDLTVRLPAKVGMSFSAIGVFGLVIPTSCKTVEPLSLDLVATPTAAELLNTGAHFTGSTAIPKVTCEGALGGLEGGVLSGALSGPSNHYSITIAPPA